jgi:AraC-like DNA-binding protein
MSLEGIYETLKRAGRLGGRIVSPDAWYHAGMEEHTAGDAYFYDGLKRPVDPVRPFVVFQATIRGWGVYQEGTYTETIGPGRAFLAVVPSPHCYYFPEDAPQWTFFWLVIRHEYIVRRLLERQAQLGAALEIAPDSLLLSRAVTLCAGGFPDKFAEEQALFSFVTEFDRFANALQTAPEREILEADIRGYVLENLSRPVDVAELARRHQMSRSRFSHRFSNLIGQPPAIFMTEIRLEEAARRLTESDASLAKIAAATGFADANHFCKVFKRRFHITPGIFRKQVRG